MNTPNKRYDQPFFVGSNLNFRGARYGYLPPIEPPIYEEPPEEKVVIIKRIEDKYLWDLRERIKKLEDEQQEHFQHHIDKKKRTGGHFA